MREVILLLWIVTLTWQIPEICKYADIDMNYDGLPDSEVEKTKQCFSYLIEKG